MSKLAKTINAHFSNCMRLQRMSQPLVHEQMAVREPGQGQVLGNVRAGGVCRTDLT